MSIQSNLSGILSRSGEGLHTAFTAKVLASDGTTATVQPLYSPSGAPAVPRATVLSSSSRVPGHHNLLVGPVPLNWPILLPRPRTASTNATT